MSEDVVALRAVVLAQQELIAHLTRDLTYKCDSHCKVSNRCNHCKQRTCRCCEKKCYWHEEWNDPAFCQQCTQKELAIFICNRCSSKVEHCKLCLKEREPPNYCYDCNIAIAFTRIT